MRIHAGHFTICFLICFLSTHTKLYAGTLEDSLDSHLLLAGGALEICSSYSPQYCLASPPQGKSQSYYRLSKNRLSRIKNAAITSESLNIVKALLDFTNNRILNRNALDDLFEMANVKDYFDALPDHDYNLFYDTLEIMSPSVEPHNRLREIASLQDSKSESTRTIIKTFIEQAKRYAEHENTSPRILVVTASSRDSYASVDFYRSVFAVNGTDATWLPIDRVWQMASRSQQCEQLGKVQSKYTIFNRHEVYPDLYAEQQAACRSPKKVLNLIAEAHGIFFNGGDQSYTRAALFTPEGQPNEVLKAIHQRHTQGRLIVGGTSAGTAVQAAISTEDHLIPMITNGVSAQAIKRGIFAKNAPSQHCTKDCSDHTSELSIDEVTFHSGGGTGLFAYGTTDSHFSERNREGRFIALNALTDSVLGVGIDENTALLISSDNLKNTTAFKAKVLGEHGVFIYDENMLKMKQTKQGYQFSGTAHYLPNGASAKYDWLTQNWTFTSSTLPKTKANIKIYPYPLDTGIWRHYALELCQLPNKHSLIWQHDDVQYRIETLPKTQFWLTETGQCGYTHLGFSIAPKALNQ